MVKTYYMLTKPGIIMGNIVTTAAGFALASQGHINYLLFVETLVGLAFVIASAGVFNNYIDRAMDAKMERTKNRAFVQKNICSRNALQFGTFLGLTGIFILGAFTNPLTASISVFGFFVYLVLYAFLKYRSFYGTIVGSIAGAVPPVIGYCAVSNRLDTGALLLFLIMVLWQMPHFFAIAIYRLKDYAAASIPVLPVQKGIDVTKKQMVAYIFAFTSTALLLTVTGYTGYVYFMTASLLGISWLGLCFSGFRQQNDTLWAKRMFAYSLVVIMALCVTIAFDGSKTENKIETASL
jgi:heme o synthase